MAQWYWRCRGQATPEDWTLLLGIWHEGQFIGCQDIGAKDFATLKTVSTGSWLKQSVHGRGLGKEMRAAVALYAFDWLGAEVAESEAAAWNAASLGVPAPSATNSTAPPARPGAAKPRTSQKVRLTRRANVQAPAYCTTRSSVARPSKPQRSVSGDRSGAGGA